MQIRQATIDDLDALAKIEAACWSIETAGCLADIESRLTTFSAGQFVAETDGEVVGAIYGQRVPLSAIEGECTYAELTDGGTFRRSHQADGELFQLIGVSVLDRFQGAECGRLLVDHAVAHARTMPGVVRMVGITRPVHYFKHSHLTIEQYIAARDNHGRLLDPVLAFHDDGGAMIHRGIQNYRPDPSTLGYGVLIEYR